MQNSIIITGATGSIGAAAVRAMAQKGYPILMACRDMDKAEYLREELLSQIPSARLELAHLELSSLEEVRSFVASLEGRRFAGLFNNAGTMNRHYTATADGLELTMEVNYIAPYLLTRLLEPQMEEGAHIVNMVSLSTKFASIGKDVLHKGAAGFGQLSSYSHSKIALLLFSLELARRYPRLKVNMSDPGIVDSDMIRLERWFDPLTDIIFRPFCNSPEKGARPAVNALLTQESGKYFVGRGFGEVPQRFATHELKEWLWDETEKLVSL